MINGSDDQSDHFSFVTQAEYRPDIKNIVDRINTLSESQAVTSTIVKNINDHMIAMNISIDKVAENTNNLKDGMMLIKFLIKTICYFGGGVGALLAAHTPGIVKILSKIF